MKIAKFSDIVIAAKPKILDFLGAFMKNQILLDERNRMTFATSESVL